jgi:hypothetical protein
MRRLGTLALALATSGCLGTIASPPDNDDGTDPTGKPVMPGTGKPGGSAPGTPMTTPGAPTPMSMGAARNQCNGQPNDVLGPRLVRRLTTEELDATVRTIFGLDRTAWSGPALPPDPAAANGFTNNTDRLTVGDDHARDLQDMAKQVARLVSADVNIVRLVPCAATGGEACANTLLDTVGVRLYRRPLTPAERQRYMGLFNKVKTSGNFTTFAFWAVTAMLQSPNVLYRTEIGEPAGGGKYRLTPYEVATALAYTYTGAPPATDLIQLATANKLSTADQIEAAARGLVYDAAGTVKPAFREVLLDFADEWLGLSPLQNIKKDSRTFPDFGPPVQASVAEETRRFVSSVVIDGKGKAADLLTAPFTFLDATLARYYGFGAPPAAGFAQVMRPPGWGIGLLAQGSVLAVEAGNLSTSPTKRGHLVRSRLLCQDVPPPPPVVAPLPEPTDADTTRQRVEVLHLAADSCRPCHLQMDPIGFGLEHLDASGRYRDKEGRFDIDDRGELRSTSAGDIAFKGPDELARNLARLPETSECMAAFLASNAFGMDQHDTPCMVRGAIDELRAGNIGLVEYYVRMSRSEHFRNRTQ